MNRSVARHLFLILLLLAVTAGSQANPPARVDSLNQRAISFRGGHPDSVLVNAQKALDLARSSRYRKGEGIALRWVGLAHNLGGRGAEAEPVLLESLEILRDLDEASEVAATLNILASNRFRSGAYGVAGDHWHEALRIYVSLGDSSGITNIWNNLGNLHRALGENDTALEYGLRTLAYRERGTDSLLIAGSLNNVANLLSEMKRFDEAIAYHERGLALNRALGNLRSIANSLTNLGSTHLRKGDAAQAVGYYLQAVQVRQSINDPRAMAVAYTGLADAYLVLDRARDAARYAEMAYELASQLNNPREASDASQFAYRAHKRLGNAPEALRYLEIHKTLSDSLLSQRNRENIAKLEADAELERVASELEVLEGRRTQWRITFGVLVLALVGAVVSLVMIRRSHIREKRLLQELHRT